jgi:acyl CoA:acetate/3-ketoacid CoA transferase beta subunit
LKHTRRAFVETLDFRTTPGHRVSAVITDLGILEPDPMTRELTLTSVHAGITLDQVTAATGWSLKIAEPLGVTTEPSAEELNHIRELQGSAPRAR